MNNNGHGGNNMALIKEKFAALANLGKEPAGSDPELGPEQLENVSGGDIQFAPDGLNWGSDMLKIERYHHGYCPYCRCDHELIQARNEGLSDRTAYFCRAAQKFFYISGDTICGTGGEPLNLN